MRPTHCPMCRENVVLKQDGTCPSCRAPVGDDVLPGALERWRLERQQHATEDAGRRARDRRTERGRELVLGLVMVPCGVLGCAYVFLHAATISDVSGKCILIVSVCAIFGGLARLIWR